jgi:hypothetical protein
MYKQAIKFKKTENVKNKALRGPVRDPECARKRRAESPGYYLS